jgi:sec-independent protein translocase protein TatB
MFGIDSSELFIVGLVALLVIGPSRLPMAMRSVGQWVAKGRAVTRHVRTGFDAMVREAELEEMQKSWAKHNDAIMKATALNPTAMLQADPLTPPSEEPVTPATDAASEAPEANSATVMAEAPPSAATEGAAKPARPRAPKKRSAKSVDDNG